MTAVELVETLRAKGVELARAGNRLRFRPGEAVTAEERAALRQHRAEVLQLLAPAPGPDPADLARVLALPLDQLDRVLTIRVPWWPEALYFVPGSADVAALEAEGVARGRIWTREELLDVVTVPGITRAAVERLAMARLLFDSDGIEVQPGRCPACRRAEWWRARDGRSVCRVCHPPAPGAEATE